MFWKKKFWTEWWNFKWNSAIIRNWGCGGQGCYFQPNPRVISQISASHKCTDSVFMTWKCTFDGLIVFKTSRFAFKHPVPIFNQNCFFIFTNMLSENKPKFCQVITHQKAWNRPDCLTPQYLHYIQCNLHTYICLRTRSSYVGLEYHIVHE